VIRYTVTLAPYLIFLAVCAGMWSVFERIPILLTPLSAIAAAGLSLTCAVDVWLLHTRFRMPFELLWPALALLLLTLASRFAGDAALPWGFIGAAALFGAIQHHAPKKALVEYALWAMCVSGGLMACWELLAADQAAFPTAFSAILPLRHYSADTLADGFLLLLLTFGIALACLCRAPFRPWMRLVALGAMISSGMVLYRWILLLLSSHKSLRSPLWEQVTPWRLLAILLILWLLSRLIARLFVTARREASAMHFFLAVVLILAVLTALCYPPRHYLLPGAALGLIAAYATPTPPIYTALPKPHPWLLAGGSLGLACMVCFHFMHLDPLNVYDTRNYESRLAALFETGCFGELQATLSQIEQIAPQERRHHFWHSKLAISQDRLEEAADAFIAASKPSENLILAAFSEVKQERLLAELRDKTSAKKKGARGLAYERALLAAGEEKNALAALHLRKKYPQGVGFSPEPLAEVLAYMLGHPGLTETLAQWNERELLGVLASLGLQAQQAPPEFPRETLPLMAAAHWQDTRLTLLVRGKGYTLTEGRSFTMQHYVSGNLNATSWSPLVHFPGVGWHSRLRNPSSLAELRWNEGFSITYPQGRLSAPPDFGEDRWLIQLWLP